MADFSNYWVLDIETNALLSGMLDYSSLPYKLLDSASLWCVSLCNVQTGETRIAIKEECTREWLQENLKGCTVLITHNGIHFDLPALKLFGVLDYTIAYPGQKDTLFGQTCTIIDTLVFSRLFNPDRYLGHSLEQWGIRIGEHKMDFRQALIDAEALDPKAEKGAEFRQYHPIMAEYCNKDTTVGRGVFLELFEEFRTFSGWRQAVRWENKLADIAVRRENFGFKFNYSFAVKCYEELNRRIDAIAADINPILPPKPMNKGELKAWTMPKRQLTAKGELVKGLQDKMESLGANITQDEKGYYIHFEGQVHQLPYDGVLKDTVPATIKNLDHVKMFLIQKGWVPTEWRIRDLSRKSGSKDKQSVEAAIKSLNKWWLETEEGKYTEERFKFLYDENDLSSDVDLYSYLVELLQAGKPAIVPTSPSVRVGVEKELCPNLIKLGKEVEFVKGFAAYLTYKHRRSSIAGGTDVEDMDFDKDTPQKGFLAMYRHEDGRIPTPAIEIGTNTCRYKHIGVVNVPKPKGEDSFGKEMRGMFGAGEDYYQLGFDFSSLEQRVQAGYIAPYPGGVEMGESLLAEKPNDQHTLKGKELNISRDDAKSINYASIYGAGFSKIAKMLRISKDEGRRFHEAYWDSIMPVKQLKEDMIKQYQANGKKYIIGIDGRKLVMRSPHSILNVLFQSAGVIAAKYTTVLLSQYLEEEGFNLDPFVGKPDVCFMIEYHDECQLAIRKDLVEFMMFENKDEAKKYVAEYDGEDQLSAIATSQYTYITKPNIISKNISKATKETEKILDLQFNLGFEWIVGRTWYECH